jgi:hypothetical protein
MIRSTRIPSVLNRICDNGIYMVLMVTSDGELLGVSNRYTPPPPSSSSPVVDIPLLVKELPDPESLATLIADIAMDYYRLGFEFAMFNENNNNSTIPRFGAPSSSSLANLDPTTSRQQSIGSTGSSTTSMATNHGNYNNMNQKSMSSMKFSLFEMDYGMIGISSCSSNADCFVIAIATPTTPIGYIKSRLKILASYVQESLYSFQANASKQTTVEPSTSSPSGQEPTSNSTSKNKIVVN